MKRLWSSMMLPMFPLVKGYYVTEDEWVFFGNIDHFVESKI